jgi:hypothetical protein
MSEYWFARRFPVSDRRNSMAPISREGRLVALGFIVAMLVGGVIGAVMAVSGQAVLGAATFAVIAGAAGAAFIAIAAKTTDRNHTVDDYRNGAVASRNGAAASRTGTGRKAGR